MTDENLGKLVAQGVNLGNLYGTDSKEYLDFVAEHNNNPELLELLNKAFYIKDGISSKEYICEDLTKVTILIFTAIGTIIGMIVGILLGYLVL